MLSTGVVEEHIMSALDRKLVRDLWQMRGQALAICLVMACGVGVYVMALSALGSLQRNMDTYYSRYRFADVFASLKRAPNSLAPRLSEIPGVAQVQTRVVVHVTLDVPGFSEPASGRIISIPEHGSVESLDTGAAPERVLGLNDLYLRLGRYPEPGRAGEVLVSESFAQAHRFKPGDSVQAVINGRKQKLKIVGIALSPEYIYQIRPGDILPDDRRFGVFWMGYRELATAFDMYGAFNDVSLSLLRGASVPDIIMRLDRLLESYGSLGAYARADQPSHQFVSNELKELEGMALVVPTIFLAVASFLLNVVLTRLISTQREQIATLKAFGYTRLEIGIHFGKLVMVLVLVGAGIGIAFGAWMGQGLTVMYTRFFRFPFLQYHLDLSVVIAGTLISGGASCIGTLSAVVKAVRLQPAEAMRPEPPASFRPTFVERLGLQRFLPVATRMILRNLERRPGRALLSVLGISLAVSVLILGSFGLDAVEYAMESQFYVAQRHDVTVTFVEPTTGSVLHEIDQLPGVIHSEPFRSVPVRLRRGHRSRRIGILGVGPEGKLYRLRDVNRQAVPLPPAGLVLSTKLAELLDVKIGDMVTVEALEGERRVREVPLTGTIADFSGLAAYMDIDAVRRLMGEGDAVSGAYLSADANQRGLLYRKLKEAPRVMGVTIKEAALQSFRSTVAENLTMMVTFNIVFACIIAGGVVYNAARISLAERSRELATLRVLGFTRGEISLIMLGELAILVLLAVPFGLLLGYGLAWSLIHTAYDTELFRLPLVVNPRTYALAATVTIVATFLSGLVILRMVRRLDLVAVLKSKE